jgi:hypothetical protein
MVIGASSQRLEVGYWRKHAPLHNFIVRAFADGEDNCRPIDLSVESCGGLPRFCVVKI